MKLTVSKKDFQDALRKVISEKRSTLPILTNFKLRSEENRLYIYGTDLEVYSTYSIPAVVEEEGEICVSSKKLVDISKVLPNAEVLLNKQDNSLKVVSGKTKYSLPVVDPLDFPNFEKFPEDLAVKVISNDLLKGINRTVYAASKDESRYTLNGVCFSFTDTKLDLVATDGHRLSLYKIDYKGKVEKGKYIVPLKALSELKKLLPDAVDVDIAVNGSNMFFRSENWSLQTRLLDGIFPDYIMVIPKDYLIQIIVDRNQLLEGIKRVVVAIEESTKPVKIDLESRALRISSASDGTVAEDELEIDYSGEHFQIGFNGSYLIDAIEEIETGECIIEFTGKDSQTVIKPSKETQSYIAIVMPMNI